MITRYKQGSCSRVQIAESVLTTLLFFATVPGQYVRDFSVTLSQNKFDWAQAWNIWLGNWENLVGSAVRTQCIFALIMTFLVLTYLAQSVADRRGGRGTIELMVQTMFVVSILAESWKYELASLGILLQIIDMLIRIFRARPLPSEASTN